MFVTSDEHTIVAQCTPSGSGAIALIRLSGVDALLIANSLSNLSSEKQLSSMPTHTIHYGWVVDQYNKPIDQVLFLLMKAPCTFTGQDTIEITCHNNQFIIEAIIERTIQLGARLAHAGEFSKRAVINGKIDLLQAEAIHELVCAHTQQGMQTALSQIQGSLSDWVTSIEKDLIKALAYTNASFEFLDEELEFNDFIKNLIDSLIYQVARIKGTQAQQRHIKEGIRIAIIGAVNVGKSSLFNALLNQERAIVTEVEGTTRDVIESHLYEDGVYWTLIDTAGIRVTDDKIEHEGIVRSYHEAQKADLILLVADGSRTVGIHEREFYSEILKKFEDKILSVCMKADLAQVPVPFFSEDVIAISTRTSHHIPQLKNELKEQARKLITQHDSPYVFNKRQLSLLSKLQHDLEVIQKMFMHDEVVYELVAHHVHQALENFGQLTGKSVSAKSFDALFKEFCVGK